MDAHPAPADTSGTEDRGPTWSIPADGTPAAAEPPAPGTRTWACMTRRLRRLPADGLAAADLEPLHQLRGSLRRELTLQARLGLWMQEPRIPAPGLGVVGADLRRDVP